MKLALLLAIVAAGCQQDASNADLGLPCSAYDANRDCTAQCGHNYCSSDPVCENGHWVFDRCIDVGDLSMLSCAGYLLCAHGCKANPQCMLQCRQVVSSPVEKILFDAYQCASAWCSTANDLAAPRCESGGDPSGAPAGTCRVCTDDAIAALLGYSCDPTSNDCNARACVSYYVKCLAN
jgi:hypothetical protein